MCDIPDTALIDELRDVLTVKLEWDPDGCVEVTEAVPCCPDRGSFKLAGRSMRAPKPDENIDACHRVRIELSTAVERKRGQSEDLVTRFDGSRGGCDGSKSWCNLGIWSDGIRRLNSRRRPARGDKEASSADECDKSNVHTQIVRVPVY
jgi:hypothetical protein